MGLPEVLSLSCPVSVPSSVSREPAHRAPDAPTAPRPKGGHSARRQKRSFPAHPDRGQLGRRARHWETLPLQGLPSATASLTGHSYCSPTLQAGRDSTHNSQGIFSLHQNNLTADGRRHPQYGSSSP